MYLFILFMERLSYFKKMNPPCNNNPEVDTSLTSTDTYIDAAKEYFDAIFDAIRQNLCREQKLAAKGWSPTSGGHAFTREYL